MNNLPLFSQVDPTQIESQLENLLNKNRQKLKSILEKPQENTWDYLMRPLEEMDDEISQFWSPINHLHSVRSTEALRKGYAACLPMLSDYSTEIGQNVRLFEAIKALKNSEAYVEFNSAQQRVIDHLLRDFRLAGVELPEADRKKFGELKKQLSQLGNQFEQNVLDATDGWEHLVTDSSLLSGLPEHAVAMAKQAAEKKGLKGWLFNLEAPSYIAVMTYADSQALREKLYVAYVTRASNEGPNAGRWNNDEIIQSILEARLKLAQLLGFDNYAELSLVPKMAKNTQEVITFLTDLVNASHAKALEEFEQLKKFVKEKYQITSLNPWDIAYFSEKLRQAEYAISQEDLRPYFPEDKVLSGLFDIVHRLFGIKITEKKGVDLWDPAVRFFEIVDETGRLRGQFYFDLYARPQKRGGAWMDDARDRRKLEDGSIQIPVAYLTCNFNAPVGNQPALFTHDDVLTLFHEFGHGLQHMLTTVDYAPVSGIHGVPWDAVEIASQFLENWCFEKEGLDLISSHYQTHEPLPDALYQKLRKAKNFQSALMMVRQLEFSLFDFRLHMEFDPKQKNQAQAVLDEVRAKVAVFPVAPFNRFQNSFSHIFAGGYAAGYYSYKWAEVLACDAFSKFEENGILDPKTGREFMQWILETGGTEDPQVLFEKFRGRPARIDAFLKSNGVQS